MILQVEDLTVSVREHAAVDGVSLSVRQGEILGVVGESGSGKSLTALSIMGMLPTGVRATGGAIRFDGRDLLGLDEPALRQVRGKDIGMVFQDPLAYLNPRMTVGAQLAEAMTVHGTGAKAAKTRAAELLDLVGITGARGRLGDHPHEFSGGQRQRVLIAMAMANEPRLLIADEPTTALDVTVQAGILSLLRRLRDDTGTAVVIITHDMGIVEQVCDAAAVMYGGQIVEHGATATLLGAPRHPYTHGLLQSVPRLGATRVRRLPVIPGAPPDLADRPPGCPFAPRCAHATDECHTTRPPLTGFACFHPLSPAATVTVRDEQEEPAAREPSPPVLVADAVSVVYGRRRKAVTAVSQVSLEAGPGRTVGIIGESGSGKSTLARALLGLLPLAGGEVSVAGRTWDGASAKDRQAMRRAVQMVFQDPYLSLNPRLPIRRTLAEPFEVHGLCQDDEIPERLDRLMDQVGLPRAFLDRLPYQLSGGQRQRIGVARALAVEPQVIVADEPVSALDVSVQAQILNLLADLRDETGVGIVFIAHDLGLVRHFCDETLVMYQGEVVERGPSQRLFEAPEHPYTKSLVSAAY
ncbi:ABC transporter ATP-binding protein [Nonomuraea sp. NBC_01738]|uniref:ABC transporter ATP-binding protein n=1 Tax=Nonomuraea sp. NBC_01738 TaxID=2976003 RepID=UPI002E0FC7C3|nr:ABC transporter ATP-binding protein [Nonomuraea sp. NBC_01738]